MTRKKMMEDILKGFFESSRVSVGYSKEQVDKVCSDFSDMALNSTYQECWDYIRYHCTSEEAYCLGMAMEAVRKEERKHGKKN